MHALNTYTHTRTFLKKKKEKKTNLLKGRRRYVILLIHIWVGFVNVLKRARVCLFEQKRMANGTKNAGIGLFFFFAQQAKNREERNQCYPKLIKLMLITIMINHIVECLLFIAYVHALE